MATAAARLIAAGGTPGPVIPIGFAPGAGIPTNAEIDDMVGRWKATVIRSGISWDGMSSNVDGVFDQTNGADALVAYCCQKKIGLIFQVGSGTTNNGKMYVAATRIKFAQFCRAVMARYNGTTFASGKFVLSVSCGNEPNHNKWDDGVTSGVPNSGKGAAYAEIMIRIASPFFNNARGIVNCPPIQIAGLGGETFRVGIPSYDFTVQAYQPLTVAGRSFPNGWKGSFDLFDQHPYTYPTLPSQDTSGGWFQMLRIRDYMLTQGDDKPIVITEIGAPTNPETLAEYEKAKLLLVDAVREAQKYPWIWAFCWFSWMNNNKTGLTSTQNDNDFGIVLNNATPSLAVPKTGTTTPGYAAKFAELAAGSGTPPPPPPVKPLPKIVGLCAAGSTSRAASIGARPAGVKLKRIDVNWWTNQPTNPTGAAAGLNDTFTWTNLDAILTAAATNGYQIIGMCAYTPPWAGGNGTDGHNYPRDPANNYPDYANFCRAVAARAEATRPGTLIAIEWWNEPNQNFLAPVSVANFAKLCQGAQDAVKTGAVKGRANRTSYPQIITISGGTGAAPAVGNVNRHLNWTRTLVQTAAHCADHFGIHAYSGGCVLGTNNTYDPLKNDVPGIRTALNANTRSDAQIVNTESGFFTRPDSTPTNTSDTANCGNYGSGPGDQKQQVTVTQAASLLTASANAWFASTAGVGPFCYYEQDNSQAASTTAGTTQVSGITIDDISGMAAKVTAISALSKPMTTRVVFDQNQAANVYTTALGQLNPVTSIMGELCDSLYIKRFTGGSTGTYVTRAQQYLAAHSSTVDIWEYGNEVNGNWVNGGAGSAAGIALGRAETYQDVANKLDLAFGVFDAAGKTTAITLYYNPNNVDGPGEPTPVAWSQTYATTRMKIGTDYVLLSWYPTQFNNYQPDNATLIALFQQLHQIWPNAKLGFGELGLPTQYSQATTADQTTARAMMAHYYALDLGLSYYIGGYFWWYGAEDILPSGAPLKSNFDSALASQPAGAATAGDLFSSAGLYENPTGNYNGPAKVDGANSPVLLNAFLALLGSTADTTGPTVNIPYPAENATITGNFVILASVADTVSPANAIVTKLYKNDGATLVATMYDAADGVPFGFNKRYDGTPTGWPDGTYQLRVKATDQAGNLTTSARRTITVANGSALPRVDSVTPNHGPAAGGTTITITGKFPGATGVTIGGNACTGFSLHGPDPPFFPLLPLHLESTTPPAGDTVITCVTPAGTQTRPVLVTSPAGTSPASVTYTYDTVVPPGDFLSADSFNRANSTTVLGSTDGNGTLDPLAWTQDVGVWGIASNQAELFTGVGGDGSYAVVDLNESDVDITIKLSVRSASTGLIFRYVDSDNHWLFLSDNANNCQVYIRAGGGVYGARGSNHNTGNADGDVLRIVAVGSTIYAYRNGVLLETLTGQTGHQSATKQGFSSWNPGARFDDWLAVSAPVGAVPTITSLEPTVVRLAGGDTVTATGTNMGTVTAATVGGTAATSVTPLSATQVTFVTPAGSAPGPVDVTLTNPTGNSGISVADILVYLSEAPTGAFTGVRRPDGTLVTDLTQPVHVPPTGIARLYAEGSDDFDTTLGFWIDITNGTRVNGQPAPDGVYYVDLDLTLIPYGAVTIDGELQDSEGNVGAI